MAIERIDIVIREVGGTETRKVITDIGTEAEKTGERVKKANTVLDQFKSILLGIGAIGAIKILQQTADAYRDITNALQLVTRDTNELRLIEDKLFSIAQESNQEMKSTVQIYSQLRQGSAQYGLQASDVLQITQTLSQALDASGKSGGEAAGAIQQLAKSVAQGEVGGRALVAVFQQVPLVARAIAQSLRVPISRLNELAAAGQITGKDLLKALQGNELIAKAAAQEVDTISDAWTNVKNSFQRYIGTVDQGNGISQIFVQGLVLIAQNFTTLAGIVAVATVAFVAYRAAIFAAAFITPIYAATQALAATSTATFATATTFASLAVGAFVGVLRAAWLVLMAHPFIFLATAIAAAVAAFITFGQSIQINGISVVGALTVAVRFLGDAWTWLVAVLSPVTGFLQQLWSDLRATYELIRQSEVAWRLFVGVITAVGIALAISLLPTLAAVAAAFVVIGETVTVVNGGALGEFTMKVVDVAQKLKNDFVTAAQAATAEMEKGNTTNVKYAGSLDDIGSAASGAEKKIQTLKERVAELDRDFGTAEQSHKKWKDSIAKNLDDAMQKLQETSKKYADNTSRDLKTVDFSMNQSSAVTREWAKTSMGGMLDVSAAANNMADSVKNAVGSTSSAMNSVTGGSSGGGGGSSTGSRTGNSDWKGTFDSVPSTTVAPLPAGLAAIIKSMGVDPIQLWRMQSQAVSLRGTPSGIEADMAFKNYLKSLPEQARDVLRDYGFAPWAKFAKGGSFMVGGNGGTDSQAVRFMASPNERVTVETPAQYRARMGGGGRDGGRPIVVNMNISTPDANGFRRSETQIAQAALAKLSQAASMY